jgi:hypothetical protein
MLGATHIFSAEPQRRMMGGFCELRRESRQNKLRAMVFYEQEGAMSNVRVFFWLTWLMACKLLAEIVPGFRQQQRQPTTTGEIG